MIKRFWLRLRLSLVRRELALIEHQIENALYAKAHFTLREADLRTELEHVQFELRMPT